MSEEKEKEKEKKEETRLKVYARVRPAFEGEFDKGAYNVLELGEDAKSVSLRERTYEFDRVFPGTSHQGEIFEMVAKPTIDNAFEGFTGTVFVYGQTGTGKTHTMSNRAAALPDQGIIPRAINYLFTRIAQEPEHRYTLTMQYLQLYRDNLQDLQAPDTPFLKLENTPDGGTRINGVTTSKPLTSVKEFFAVYDEADKNRVVAETMMNKQSSRGHSVLTLFLKREAQDNLTPAVKGKLVFVDLAGYERIKKTMITDEIRKHEAQAINLSLSALATCIAAITSKATHVPFRNSRLTRILYDSLVGNSVTSVIITLGPSSLHTTETVNTLYFGHNAIQCKTTVKRDTGPVDWQKEALDWKKRAAELTKQVTELEAENTLLVGKLNHLDPGAIPVAEEGPTSLSSSTRDLSWMKSGNQGLEKLLEELQRVKQELVETKVQLRNSEEETEEARVSTEETAWLLEQERGRVVAGEANVVDLRRQVELLKQQVLITNEQLEIADAQLTQLVPDGQFSPTHEPSIRITGTIHEHSHISGNGVKPVFITYSTDKYVSWADLVKSELEHDKVKATTYDRSHWFVSVPEMARYVADDRREFHAAYMEYRSPQRSFDRAPASPSPQRGQEQGVKIRIEGTPVVMSTLTADLGGVPLTRDHEVVWEVSDNGYDFGRVNHSSGESSLYVTANLCHKYIRACLKWQERKQYTQLVYINLPLGFDEQMQQYVLQGGTLFEVLAATSTSNNVNTKTSMAVECNGTVVLANEEEEHLFDVVTVVPVVKGEMGLLLKGAKDIEIKAGSQKERELIILVIRLFKVLRTPHVAEKMLGDVAKQWLDGSWLKEGTDAIHDRMALQPRLRAASKSGHWSSGVQSPNKRAGGQSTFLHRAEEIQETPLGGAQAAVKVRDASGSRTSEVMVYTSSDTIHQQEREQSFHSPAVINTQPTSPATSLQGVGTGTAAGITGRASTSTRPRGSTMSSPSPPKQPARRGNVFCVPQNSFGPRKMSMVNQKRHSSLPLSALALRANDYLTTNEVCSVGTSDETTGTTQVKVNPSIAIPVSNRPSQRSVQIASNIQIHDPE
eukprot:TRINITY_DN47592_c0_g1_i1.p1 TRINITY_DN47592_c0_g1~~TRINITY_DN47592_c0_g1_i1.p1  ORF type:complete len:1069 (+),score=275.60 TRINITY_DN47592_c0_g1_i1:51-3257(+)